MVSPLRIERETLTGRVRGRPNTFGRRLTMQVEVRIESADGFRVFTVFPPPGHHDPDQWRQNEKERVAREWHHVRTIWRDATWLDQLTLAGDCGEAGHAEGRCGNASCCRGVLTIEKT